MGQDGVFDGVFYGWGIMMQGSGDRDIICGRVCVGDYERNGKLKRQKKSLEKLGRGIW